jgi:hypothetical protein
MSETSFFPSNPAQDAVCLFSKIWILHGNPAKTCCFTGQKLEHPQQNTFVHGTSLPPNILPNLDTLQKKAPSWWT